MMLSNKCTQLLMKLVYLYISIHKANCELYTSADALSEWSQHTSHISVIIQDMVEDHELRLKQLRRLQNSIRPLVDLTISGSKDGQIAKRGSKVVGAEDELMKNPVNAFVTIHRLQRVIEGVDELFSSYRSMYPDEHDDNSEDLNQPVSSLQLLRKLRNELSFEDDLWGSARALLRLQAFYDLNINQLVNGIVESSATFAKNHSYGSAGDEIGPLRMNVWDCLELGKIAFREDLFKLAIEWLTKTHDMIYDEERNESDQRNSEVMINEILDYMAFAAYKLDMVADSAKLTRAWLEREPDNQRARENLDYYLELLEQGSDEDESIKTAEEPSAGEHVSSYPYLRNGIEDYSLTDDQIVRHLCRNFQEFNQATTSGELKCELDSSLLTRDGRFCPGLKIELLNQEPRVVRFHDIITHKEAAYLRGAARPLLERSTVNSGDGLKTSDFRIAKTAWLSAAKDELVGRVEQRLAAAISLNMDSSEQLQVVNYGLGGFYGPHLDSARKQRLDDESVMLSELHRNDRLATVLVYLSQVEAGGATVFPKLNLTVAPVEHSAVVWFNILPTGHSDERTLHTACPVLLGSKWIATKWPRERANAFTQPCKTSDAPPGH